MSFGNMGNVISTGVNQLQNYSWYPTYLALWNQGEGALKAAAESGVFNQFPDFDAFGQQVVSGALANMQDTTSNLFGANLDSSTVEHIGDAAGTGATAGLIVGGALAGGELLGGGALGTGGTTLTGATGDATLIGGAGADTLANSALTGAGDMFGSGAVYDAGAGALTAGGAAVGGGLTAGQIAAGTGAVGTGAEVLSNGANDPNTNTNSGSASGDTSTMPNNEPVTVPGDGTPPTTPPTSTTDGMWTRVMNGTATADDWAKILGTAGATGLSIYGANEQANTLKSIYDDMVSKRQPYLTQANQWLADPNSYINGPGAASMQGVLRGLSVNGNPMGSGTSLELATEAGLRNWQNAVTGMANIGLTGEDSRANVATNAANAAGNVYTDIGRGIGTLTNPPRQYSLNDIYKATLA